MHRHLTVFAGSWKFAFRAKSEFLAVLFLVVVASSGCSKQQAAPAPRVTAIPVVVAKVTQKAMPVQLTAIGNVGSDLFLAGKKNFQFSALHWFVSVGPSTCTARLDLPYHDVIV